MSDSLLPFGLPFPTAMYLSLYVVTLTVHVVFMNYVIAGSALLLATSLRGGRIEDEPNCSARAVFRDWLPFGLSAAITAGVAPLLFVQILYKREFYTANLLLFHRWMSILPILIVGFYLLYLQKSKWIRSRSAGLRALVAVGALACFAFTGWSWTENHLLSTSAAAWAEHYKSEAMWFPRLEIIPRLLTWFIGGIPAACMILAWQLRARCGDDADAGEESASRKRVATAGMVGLALGALFAFLYYITLDGVSREAVTGPRALAWLLIASGGALIQAISWFRLRRCRTWCGLCLSAITAGVFVTTLGISVCRESIRVARLDFPALYENHAQAAEMGGIVVFFVFAVIVIAATAWTIRSVRQSLEANPTRDV